MTLCIDTSDQKAAKVALKEDGKIVDQVEEENPRGSEILLPLIAEILKQNNLNFSNLSALEVDEGPGSFTGLRVGASAAQALGLALNIPVNGKIGKPLRLRYT